MSTRQLIAGYASGLLREWYLVAIAIFDFVGLLIQPFLSFEIPIWVNLVVFALVFVYANYSLYRKGRKEVLEIEERFRSELVELQNRIAELQDFRPRLELLFQTNRGLARHHILLLESLPEEPSYGELLRREAESIMPPSQDSARDVEQDPIRALMKAVSERASPLRKSDEEFGAECKAYLERYSEYLRDLRQYQLFHARYRRVVFALRNTGRVPAESIVLKIGFPDEFHFPAYEDELEDSPFRVLGERPERPPRPTRDKSLSDVTGHASFISLPPIASAPSDIGMYVGPSGVRGPFIKPSNSTEVKYEVDRLLHNVDELVLEPVEFNIAEDAVGRSWQLDFSIHAANLPDAIEGSLTLEVRLTQAQQL